MINILYVCTHNRCRSILSEAITNHMGQGKLRAFSAGSAPSGQVHPLSLKALEQHGYPISDLKSQSWDDFDPAFFADNIDLVITVCDQANQEACPVWMGKQIKLHWALVDPSKATGSTQHIDAEFSRCIDTIEKRVRDILTLDTNNLSSFSEQLRNLVNNKQEL